MPKDKKDQDLQPGDVVQVVGTIETVDDHEGGLNVLIKPACESDDETPTNFRVNCNQVEKIDIDLSKSKSDDDEEEVEEEVEEEDPHTKEKRVVKKKVKRPKSRSKNIL